VNEVKQTKQKTYYKKVVKFLVTINPESEAETLASLTKLAEIHGGRNQAIKHLILSVK